MFVIFLILTLIVVYCSIQLKKYIDLVRIIDKLPGRKYLPILGNSLDFLGTPETAFQELRNYAGEFQNFGVWRAWVTVIPLIGITSPEDAERLLGNPVHNKKSFIYEFLRPWLADGLLLSEGTKWQSRKKLLASTFHFNVLQKFLVVFHKESKNLVEKIKPIVNQEVDIKKMVGELTLNVVCETAMGLSLNENAEKGDKYRNAVYKFGEIFVYRHLYPWLLLDCIFYFTKTYSEQKESVKTLHSFSTDVIKRRKKELEVASKENINSSPEGKPMAILDLLLDAQKHGEDISDENIREEVDNFIFGGYDTVAVSLSYTLMLLANNRECQDRIYEEILSVDGTEERELSYKDLQELKYMERCIKESLRLYPSAPMISRCAGEDIKTSNGWIIPKGCTIRVLIYDLHRRADLYPDPEKFDPDRFLLENVAKRHPYAYIPFSAGIRNCMGQKYAMAEMKCVLTTILKEYVLHPIDTPQSLPGSLSFVLTTEHPIRIKFVPRNSS